MRTLLILRLIPPLVPGTKLNKGEALEELTEAVWYNFVGNRKDTLECFKTAFLTRFEGTDEGDVTTYLGGELIRDRQNRTITYSQSVYARKILQIYCAWDKPAVKTPLEAGIRLSKADSPSYLNNGTSLVPGHYDAVQPGVCICRTQQVRAGSLLGAPSSG
eukprot:662240-Rhodomonas_salina.1